MRRRMKDGRIVGCVMQLDRRFRDFRFERVQKTRRGVHAAVYDSRDRCTHACAYRRGMRDSLHILPSFSYPSPVSPLHSLCRFVNRSRNSATDSTVLKMISFFFLLLLLVA